jgi:hypothetical protein
MHSSAGSSMKGIEEHGQREIGNRTATKRQNASYATSSRLSRAPSWRPGPNTVAVRDLRVQTLKNQSYANGLAPGSLVGTVADIEGRGSTNTTSDDYRIGDIIRVIHLTPNNDPKARIEDKSVGYNASTGPSQHKFRPSVVVGIYAGSLKCVPIFSSHGNGLSFKSSALRQDCVYVSEVGNTNTSQAKEHSVPEAIADASLRPGSYIHFTRDFPVGYREPIEHMGRLLNPYDIYVVKRYRLSIEKGLKRVNEHRAWQENALDKLDHSLGLGKWSRKDGWAMST